VIRRKDLHPTDDELRAVAGNSGPGFPLPPILCTVCGRTIEVADGRWVHRWPLPGADHPATPRED
jgi:hypothetical protein